MRLGLVFSILAVMVLSVGMFTVSEPVKAKEWRLALCYGKNATIVDKKYRKAITQTAASVFHVADDKSELIVKIRDCVKEPALACYADSEAIFCREEPLGAILRTSAWLTAESAFIYMKFKGKTAALDAAPLITWADAMRLADAESDDGAERFNQYGESIMERHSLSAEGLNSIYSLVNDLYYYTNNDEDPGKKNAALLVALKMYREVNQMVYAFILGHEGYHFNDNKCPVEKPIKIETDGRLKEIYSLQLKKGLFDPAITLDKNELEADLCGFRWVAASARQKHFVKDEVLSALSKRVAIDALASPILTGLLNSFDSKKYGHDAPVSKVVDGYLYPQSRMALAALALSDEEETYPEAVKICHDTALAMVHSIQEEVKKYPATSGYIPDSLLASLAKGVERAWNGDVWSDESVACRSGVK